MPSLEGKSGFRFTYLILGFSIVAVIGSYLYSLWTASQREKAMLPRPAVDQIVKALRTYHHQVGRFPQSFVELEGRSGGTIILPASAATGAASPWPTTTTFTMRSIPALALCGRYPSINDEKRARLSSSLSLLKQYAAGREHLSHWMRSSDFLVFPNLRNSHCSDSPSNNQYNYNREEMAERLPSGIDNASKNQRNEPPPYWRAYQGVAQACGPPRSQSAL